MKKTKKKIEINDSKIEEKTKKVSGNVYNSAKFQYNKEFQELLNFNIFSVLENEELRQESIDQNLSGSLKIPEKALKKMIEPKKIFRKHNAGSVDMASSEGKYPEVARCIKCFVNHFPSTKSCKFYAENLLMTKLSFYLKAILATLKKTFQPIKLLDYEVGLEMLTNNQH